MYRSFYRLAEFPFELKCDPRFVFYTTRHRWVLNRLEHALVSGGALTVLLGSAGTGKTTLFRALLQSERSGHIGRLHLANPALMRQGLIDALLAEFGPDAHTAPPVTTPRERLQVVLRERRSKGLAHALTIDEAETLSDEMLEELDMLATMDADGVPLLPMVLAGQPAIGSRLDQPGLERLKGRVSLRCELAPLELLETASYILAHARAAGADGGELFTREAVVLIHEISRGIPRTINVICDNALLSGFSRKLKPVTHDIVRDVCGQLDLGDVPHVAPPAWEPRLQVAVAIERVENARAGASPGGQLGASDRAHGPLTRVG